MQSKTHDLATSYGNATHYPVDVKAQSALRKAIACKICEKPMKIIFCQDNGTEESEVDPTTIDLYCERCNITDNISADLIKPTQKVTVHYTCHNDAIVDAQVLDSSGYIPIVYYKLKGRFVMTTKKFDWSTANFGHIQFQKQIGFDVVSYRLAYHPSAADAECDPLGFYEEPKEIVAKSMREDQKAHEKVVKRFLDKLNAIPQSQRENYARIVVPKIKDSLRATGSAESINMWKAKIYSAYKTGKPVVN